MIVDIASIGNTVYTALKDDINAEATIVEERKALALKIATNPDASAQVTNATVNGQSFTVSQTMTNAQRLKMLSWVCACFTNGGTISKTTRPYF